ncbi:FeoA family protein [Caldicellulosiruptor owensensis OL]|uniref:FeoA family protein n=1 Tax=Caldicellulosiruptor owensensis (strain ATCC 700167 / DSM 13100 / OL) TaxID=632518 RepID=E4Q2F7_CALOW|nr:ferrous iron transport protein A [Caldicellulosiruptor owensensis]ADQ04899.1 FeoA family protein [Caldicellulosiruptor owensensis OL]
MTLDKVSKGQEVVIKNIKSKTARVYALRFGISEGSKVKCVTKINNGPIILRKNHQEIAIGNSLAKQIEVDTQK